jgi:hypothetical protein
MLNFNTSAGFRSEGGNGEIKNNIAEGGVVDERMKTLFSRGIDYALNAETVLKV